MLLPIPNTLEAPLDNCIPVIKQLSQKWLTYLLVFLISILLVLGGWITKGHLYTPTVIYSAPLTEEVLQQPANPTYTQNLDIINPVAKDQVTEEVGVNYFAAISSDEAKLSAQDLELVRDSQAAVINSPARQPADNQRSQAEAPRPRSLLNPAQVSSNQSAPAVATTPAAVADTSLGSKASYPASRSPAAAPPASSAPAANSSARRLRTPILMYHYISTPPADADVLRQDLSVSPENFKAQLEYLRSTGYHSVTLEEFALALKEGGPLPDKPIVLTFDDGYQDHYTNAYPILHQYGFRATFFIITDFVDQQRSAYVTWDQLKEMSQGGMEIAAHTRDHTDLRNRTSDFLVFQLLGPWEQIKSHVGKAPRTFAYPGGFYDKKTLDIIATTPYLVSVTTKQGVDHSSDRMFELNRVRVRGSMTAQGLAGAIAYFAK